MPSAMKYFLTMAIILSAACSAFALQCFHCDSSRDIKCGEKLEDKDIYKVDCDRLLQQQPQLTAQFGPFYKANATSCVKRTYEYLPGVRRIERTCFYGGPRDNCNVLSETNNPMLKSTSCEKCTSELCNTSSAIAPVALAIAIFALFTRLL